MDAGNYSYCIQSDIIRQAEKQVPLHQWTGDFRAASCILCLCNAITGLLHGSKQMRSAKACHVHGNAMRHCKPPQQPVMRQEEIQKAMAPGIVKDRTELSYSREKVARELMSISKPSSSAVPMLTLQRHSILRPMCHEVIGRAMGRRCLLLAELSISGGADTDPLAGKSAESFKTRATRDKLPGLPLGQTGPKLTCTKHCSWPAMFESSPHILPRERTQDLQLPCPLLTTRSCTRSWSIL